ncbi:hypothetical protein EW146_g6973 [Bondarzewia mesenterica]|uniref:Uncharacterized protein n=1 Tax=Bondarzewia mesenterica TaxID=1095465 RepID=A0A4S4LMQ6_9AGAM|nr:hypothetical protein EW146_g6973 [Bondarzewia mesenterica]
MVSSVTINPPNTTDFQPQFELEGLMGTCFHPSDIRTLSKGTLRIQRFLFGSAVPPQNKKDVRISYTPIPTDPSPRTPIQFNDIVEYRSSTALPSSKPARVVGIDTLNTASASPTRFKWRGKGLLMIASSRWQLLGYHHHTSSDPQPDSTTPWAVTYFEKTLFTPAGLDIYARKPEGLPENLLQDIISGLRGVGGEVAVLAESLFEVQRSEQGQP